MKWRFGKWIHDVGKGGEGEIIKRGNDKKIWKGGREWGKGGRKNENGKRRKVEKVMKVKEVLAVAAELLGISDDVATALNGGSGEGSDKVNGLLSCFQLVENGLALDYLPLVAEETVSVADGKVLYALLKKKVARILAVKDLCGNAVAFALYPTYLRVGEEKAVVRYAFLPDKKGLEEESDYQSCASVATLAYGVASEFCMAHGLYAEGAVWEKKFKESVARACARKHGGRVRARIWV